ncbi:hypothetical protein [Streptomyces sp. NPDC003015]
MTGIVRYGRPDRAIDPVHSGLVTLRGTGGHELSPTAGEAGREVMPVIRGGNPVAP